MAPAAIIAGEDMPIGNMVYLDDPTEVTALDVTREHLGAPGRPGELRFHMHEEYGFQVYRLLLSEKVVDMAAYHMGMTTHGAHWDGPVISAYAVHTTPLPGLSGISQVLIPAHYWGWLLVGGEGLWMLEANVALNAVLNLEDVADNGHGNDNGHAGATKIGIALAATGTAAAATRVFIQGLI